MSSTTLTCRDFIEFLIDYVDGQLPDDRRRIFDEHMAICPDCVAYLDSYKTTVKLEKLAFSSHDSLPADLPDDLARAILKSKRR